MKSGTFPRYMAVAGSFLMMALLHPMLQTCFSLFLVPVTTDLGIQRSAFSLCTSIVALMGFLFSAQAAKWLSGNNAKTVLLLCITGLGLSYASYGFANRPIHLYISALLVGMFSCGAMSLPISIILTRWFPKSSGTVIAIAFAGSGIGGSVMTPLLTYHIANCGWRKTFLLAGIIVMLMGLLIGCVFLSFPEQQVKKGDHEYLQGQYDALHELYRNIWFRIYLIGIFFMAFVAFAGIGQLAACLTDRYSETFSAAVLSFMLICLTPAKMVLGSLYDKKGIRYGAFYVQGACIISMLMLAADIPVWLVWPMAIIFAVGNCCGTVSPPVLTGALFGGKLYAPILGVVNAACMLGNMMGPLVVSAVYDYLGSYRMAWLLCAALSVAALVCVVAASKNICRIDV